MASGSAPLREVLGLAFAKAAFSKAFAFSFFQGGSLSHGGPWPPHCTGFELFQVLRSWFVVVATFPSAALEPLTTLEYF